MPHWPRYADNFTDSFHCIILCYFCLMKKGVSLKKKAESHMKEVFHLQEVFRTPATLLCTALQGQVSTALEPSVRGLCCRAQLSESLAGHME